MPCNVVGVLEVVRVLTQVQGQQPQTEHSPLSIMGASTRVTTKPVSFRGTNCSSS
jgi:hypothetical protein